MTRILIELDDETARRLSKAAAARGRPFAEFLREQIESLPAAGRDPFRELNWDDALIDRILHDAMTARENQPLRRADGNDSDRH